MYIYINIFIFIYIYMYIYIHIYIDIYKYTNIYIYACVCVQMYIDMYRVDLVSICVPQAVGAAFAARARAEALATEATILFREERYAKAKAVYSEVSAYIYMCV